jgi:hypothetical protein
VEAPPPIGTREADVVVSGGQSDALVHPLYCVGQRLGAPTQSGYQVAQGKTQHNKNERWVIWWQRNEQPA